MSKKYRTIQETVEKDREDLEGNLSSVIDTLNDWRNKYGGDARIEMETDDYGYGIEVKIHHDRDETDAERTARLANAKMWRQRTEERKAQQVEKEKARLVDLINKYGVPGEKSS